MAREGRGVLRGELLTFNAQLPTLNVGALLAKSAHKPKAMEVVGLCLPTRVPQGTPLLYLHLNPIPLGCALSVVPRSGVER